MPEDLIGLVRWNFSRHREGSDEGEVCGDLMTGNPQTTSSKTATSNGVLQAN